MLSRYTNVKSVGFTMFTFVILAVMLACGPAAPTDPLENAGIQDVARAETLPQTPPQGSPPLLDTNRLPGEGSDPATPPAEVGWQADTDSEPFKVSPITDTELEVWPESHWPDFALRPADVFQSYAAW